MTPEQEKSIKAALMAQSNINLDQANLNSALIDTIKQLDNRLTLLEGAKNVPYTPSDSIEVSNSNTD
jgi:hypothetical protein